MNRKETTFAGLFAVTLLAVLGLVSLPLASTGRGAATVVYQQSQGLDLRLNTNASTIEAGQSLDVSLSIFNALPTSNNLTASDDWSFHGTQVALWPVCDFALPAQVVVVKGNYTVDQLAAVADYTFQYECAEGATIRSVDFMPSSDTANISGLYCVAFCSYATEGPYSLGISFDADGYWNLQSVSHELNSPIVGEQGSTLQFDNFVAGVYTVAAADEWGQSAALHVVVQG